MHDLDATIFSRYADHLLQRAGETVARWTALGGIVGALLGSVLLTSWVNWPVHGIAARLVILLGGVAGLVLGHSLGARRAKGLELQAELTYHQLQFELTTLARVAQPEPAASAHPEQLAPVAPAGTPPVTATQRP